MKARKFVAVLHATFGEGYFGALRVGATHRLRGPNGARIKTVFRQTPAPGFALYSRERLVDTDPEPPEPPP